MVPVENGIFAKTFHLTMWLFQFINGINFQWDYVIGRNVGFLWQAVVLNWILWTKNDLKIFHRKQVNAPSNMKLVTSLMIYECQSCGIF